MSRTPKKPAPAADKPAAEAAVANDVIDHWIKVRTDRAASIVGYTAVAALYVDFSAWHEATFPDAELPTDTAFATALGNAPRVVIETVRTRVPFETAKMAPAASLMLRDAIPSAA